ncbi:hypothetical protein [Bradyrhizobium sp. UFLA05-112]
MSQKFSDLPVHNAEYQRDLTKPLWIGEQASQHYQIDPRRMTVSAQPPVLSSADALIEMLSPPLSHLLIAPIFKR